jgi:hypothetical protein
MDEPHRLALAYACEVHNALEAEVMLAEQHHDILLCAAKNSQDRLNAKRQRLREIKHHVGSCVNIALEQLYVADFDSGQLWHAPDETQLQCPWTILPQLPRSRTLSKEIICSQ